MEKTTADILWVTISAALVFIMQPGFMCLESGITRSKNSINVAIKNITDFGVSVVLFWLVGFGLMFGASSGGYGVEVGCGGPYRPVVGCADSHPNQ